MEPVNWISPKISNSTSGFLLIPKLALLFITKKSKLFVLAFNISPSLLWLIFNEVSSESSDDIICKFSDWYIFVLIIVEFPITSRLPSIIIFLLKIALLSSTLSIKLVLLLIKFGK